MRRYLILGALAIGLSVGALGINADGAAAAECRTRGRGGDASIPVCEPGERTGPGVRYSAFPGGNVLVNTDTSADSCQLFSEPPRNIVGTNWTTVAWSNAAGGCLPYVIN